MVFINGQKFAWYELERTKDHANIEHRGQEPRAMISNLVFLISSTYVVLLASRAIGQHHATMGMQQFLNLD